MLGLKTQETDKFIKFFEIVQKEAQKQGAVFFLDAGDGRDIETSEIEGEDLTGWLVPFSDVERFTSIWEKGEVDDEWFDCFVFAIWEMNNDEISIVFE